MFSLHVDLKNWLIVLKIWEYAKTNNSSLIQIEKWELSILHKPKPITLEKSSTTNIYKKIKMLNITSFLYYQTPKHEYE